MWKAAIVIFTAAAMIGTPVAAADMPVKAPPSAPAQIVDPWTGFYVGVNGGYSWASWKSTSIAPIFPPSFMGFTASPHVDGWVGGIQAGYNWRINNTWLSGLEADVQWSCERARSITGESFVIGDFITTITSAVGWKFSWFDTFRGRVGALIDPTTLIYVTGGAALGRFGFSQLTTASIATAGGTPLASASVWHGESTTRWGGAVGAGVEKKFTPKWSAKAEFLYLGFGTRTFLVGTGVDTSIRLNDYIARAGVNFKFN